MALQEKGKLSQQVNSQLQKNYPGNKPYTGKHWQKATKERQAGNASKALTVKRIDGLEEAQAKIQKQNIERSEQAKSLNQNYVEKLSPKHKPSWAPPEPQNNQKLKQEYKNLQTKRINDQKRARLEARTAYQMGSRKQEFNKAAKGRPR